MRSEIVSSKSPLIISDPEISSPDADARTTIYHLTEVTEADDDYCLMRYILQPGGIVPLHAHAARRTFYVLSGEVDVFLHDSWQGLGKGGVLEVPNSIGLAWRNRSHSKVTMLLIASMKSARFLRNVLLPAGNVYYEDLDEFLRLAQSYGYWFATREENASIGLRVTSCG